MRTSEDKSFFSPLPEGDTALRQGARARRRCLDYFSWTSFQRVSHYGFILFCLTVPLSIALSQIAIVSVLAFWVVTLWAERSRDLERTLRLLSVEGAKESSLYWVRSFAVPLVTWWYIAAIASLVGLGWLRPLKELSKTALYLLLPLCVVSALSAVPIPGKEKLARVRIYLVALCSGQSLAALHSIISAAVGEEIRPRIPGAVTESGQLVLVLPMLMGLLLLFTDDRKARLVPRKAVLSGGALCLALLFFAWPHLLAGVLPGALLPVLQPAAALVSALIAGRLLLPLLRAPLAQARNIARHGHPLHQPYLVVCAALLFAALLVNLKRGPWLGVFVELLLLGCLLSRRLLVASCATMVFALLALEPARERVASLTSHFMIEGGRLSMWTLGMELVGRYPLGIGLNNSNYMRTLDPSLPYLHRHMHNNFLNIAVETGWLGVAAFIWWIAVTIAIGFRLWRSLPPVGEIMRQLRMLALCSAIALFGWQVSGLVEYNFGDGEVRLIALFLMGILLMCGTYDTARDKE